MAKLPNAPLQEAVFELRWTLDVTPEDQQEVDAGFELAQGKFQGLAEADFPFTQRLYPVSLPSTLLSYKVIHQFWRGENQFPVLQLGPGILTVNDTDKNYDWENEYFPLIERGINWLFDAYKNKLHPTYINLRYIDSVELKNYDFNGAWLDFVKDNLKLDLRNQFEHPGALKHFNISQSFALEEEAELNISVNSGVQAKTGVPLLIWQTGVVITGNLDRKKILTKVQDAHQHASTLFKEMTKGPFYGSFCSTTNT